MNTETKKRETYVSPQVEAIQLCMALGESLMGSSPTPKGKNPESYENGDDYEW